MRFAAVQYSPVWEQKPPNHAAIERLVEEAEVPPGSFVLLPELSDTGFSMNLDAILDRRTLNWAADVARRLQAFVQAGYAERGADGKGRNCAALVAPDGSTLAVYRKVHPFSFSDETRFYSGGEQLVLAHCDEATIAPMICYDLRFPELWRLAALDPKQPAEIFTIGACWPVERQHHWRSLVIARAIENQAYVIAVNRTGTDPSFRYAGGSLIVGPQGEVLVEAGDQPTVLQADLDLSHLRDWRSRFPALRDAHPEFVGSIPVLRCGAPTHARSASPTP